MICPTRQPELKFRSLACNLLCPLLLILFSAGPSFGQATKNFSHADTLRGGYGPGRNDWNLIHYDLSFRVNPIDKSIQGNNLISYIDKGVTSMQVDLQQPLMIDSIVWIYKNSSWQLP